jgi:hypothetical protein
MLIVLGDLNCQYERSTALVTKIHQEMKLHTENTGRTTDYGTTIDYFFTNLQKSSYQLIRYESVFSDHKPLWLYVNKDLPNANQPSQATHSQPNVISGKQLDPFDDLQARVSKHAAYMEKLQLEEKYLDQKKYDKHLEYLNMMKKNLKEQVKCPRRQAISAQLAFLFHKLEVIKEADPIVLTKIGEKFDQYVDKLNEFRSKGSVSLKELAKLDESLQKQCKVVYELSGSSAKKQLLLQNGDKIFHEINRLRKSAK